MGKLIPFFICRKAATAPAVNQATDLARRSQGTPRIQPISKPDIATSARLLELVHLLDEVAAGMVTLNSVLPVSSCQLKAHLDRSTAAIQSQIDRAKRQATDVAMSLLAQRDRTQIGEE
jgi:hypothetical protein